MNSPTKDFRTGADYVGISAWDVRRCSGLPNRRMARTLPVQQDQSAATILNKFLPGLAAALLSIAACNAAAQTPGTPLIGPAFSGDTQVFVSFSAPVADGGNPITAYSATCVPNVGASAAGTSVTSPIAVSGLINGTSYDCSVTAINAAGNSSPSASVSVSPAAGAPLTLIGVASRKTHGAAGVFDIPVALSPAIGGAVTMEPRTGGGGQRIVFQFNATVSSVGQVTATDESSAFVTATPTMAGNEVIVLLANLANNKRVAISLPTVNGITLNAVASIGFLVGDVNGTRAVDALDIGNAKSRSGQLTRDANFRHDINASGAVNAADIAALKTRSGTSLRAASSPVVTRVEIDQTGLMLTQTGNTKQLTARAFNAQGSAINVPLTWTSSKPAIISVNSSGLATAASNNGASQIVASAGGISSAPLLAVVTQPVAGALLLSDSQIVGEPVETTPNAVPSFTNTYRVSLTGIAAPAIGAILINSESKAVAGRVVAVDTMSNPMVVTLGLVSLREMFPTLEINETIDMANTPVSIPADIAAAYNVVRTGNTFVFTPKVGQASRAAMPVSAASAAKAIAVPGAPAKAGPVSGLPVAPALGTSALPPFTSCETTITGVGGEGAPLPFALSAPPLFSVTISPTLDLVNTTANGLERFVINAEPTIKVEGGLSVAAAFEGKIECKAELFTFRVPVGGPLSFVISGLVPVGVGIEAAGKVTVATMGIGTKIEVKAKGKAGVSCPAGVNCVFERSLDSFETKLTPTLDAPSIGDLRLEPSLSAFGYMEPSIGNPFLNSLRFDFVKIKAGAKLAGSFATKTSQLADAMYASDYKASLEAGTSVGGNLSGALALFGLSSVSALDLTISTDFAKSPAGLASGAVTADKASFVNGETVNFTVKLDPATLEFFPGIGPYNVKKVQLVRKVLGTPTVVGSVDALPGDSTFNFIFNATNVGTVAEFSAFVVTWLLPLDLLALEIGIANAAATTTAIRISSGGDQTCGLSATGGVKCWGGGNLGNNDEGNQPYVAKQVFGLVSNVQAISDGLRPSCAITTAGGLKCWGQNNTFGYIGDGTTTDKSIPVDVVGLSSGVASVNAGGDSTCAVTTTGGLKCWGRNDSGELGNGTLINSLVPVDVSGLSSGVAAVTGGLGFRCALMVDGGVKCWGYNGFGRLGDGTTEDRLVPVDVIGLTSGVAAISGRSAGFKCALTIDGAVKCWGINFFGELGIPDLDFNGQMVDVPELSADVTSISSGLSHSCAIKSNGGLLCWGLNEEGQLGDGSTTNSHVPVPVQGLGGVISVSAGGHHTCAITNTGAAKCWGRGSNGQLGNNSDVLFSVVPVDVQQFP